MKLGNRSCRLSNNENASPLLELQSFKIGNRLHLFGRHLTIKRIQTLIELWLMPDFVLLSNLILASFLTEAGMTIGSIDVSSTYLKLDTKCHSTVSQYNSIKISGGVQFSLISMRLVHPSSFSIMGYLNFNWMHLAHWCILLTALTIGSQPSVNMQNFGSCENVLSTELSTNQI